MINDKSSLQDKLPSKSIGIITISEKDEIDEKNELFIEKLSFFHNSSLFSFFEPPSSLNEPSPEVYNVNPDPDFIDPFPFLITQEYVFSAMTPIENDKYLNTSLSSISKNDILKTVLSRIKSFTDPSSTEKFKFSFIYNIPFYMENIGIDYTIKHFISVLSKIVDESLQLKIAFLKVNKAIIDFLFLQGEKGYKIILENILRIVDDLFQKNNSENKNMQVLLFENYIKIAQCLNKDDLGNIILKKIISMSLDTNSNIENLLLIIKMIGKLAGKFGNDYNDKFILPQLTMLCEAQNEKINVEICSILPSLARNVKFEIVEVKINQLLLKFAEDNNYITVKKKALEILPDIITIYHEKSLYDSKIRNAFYIKIFKNLIIDKNKSVRINAFNIMGKFIALLNIDEIDNTYLNYYTSMIDEYYFNKKDFKLNIDMSLLYPSAFNFPAMLYRYGAKGWNALRKTYMNLCNDNDHRVILTLINSFNEIASIVGIEITENDLLKIYDSFLNHPSEEISGKAVQLLTKTIIHSKVDIKKKYISYYIQYFGIQNIEEYNNVKMGDIIYDGWRDKIKHCSIIECFYDIFNENVVYSKILPVLILMCIDDYYKVRKKCASVFGKVILFLKKNYTDKIKQILYSFAFSVCFNIRAEFCKTCEELLNDQDLYHTLIKDILYIISFDKISNVRIALMKMCGNLIRKNKHITKNYLLYDKTFLGICYRLINDKQKSVREKFDSNYLEKVMQRIKENKVNVEEDAQKFYYKFNNNMEFLIDEFDISLPKAITNYEKDANNKDDYIKVFI